MPVIEVSLPSILLRDVRFLARYNEIDEETFILWALTEKIGELKGEIFNRAIQGEAGKIEPLIQRYPTIKKLFVHENFIAHLEFEGGLDGTFDIKPLIERLGLVKTLSRPGVSKTFKISDDSKTIQWINPVTNEVTAISMDILLDEMWHPKEKSDLTEHNFSNTEIETKN